MKVNYILKILVLIIYYQILSKKWKFLYQQFYEKELLPLNKPTGKIIIYIIPFIFNKNSFNLQNKNNIINEICLNLNEKNNNKVFNYNEVITLSLINNQYEIVYCKDYVLKFQKFFNYFQILFI